jgi:hypothetical protein
MDGWTCQCIAQQFIDQYLKHNVVTSTLKAGADREIIYYLINYNEYNFEDIKKLYTNKNYLTIIADFSFKKEEIYWLFENSVQLIWADHHETAIPIYDSLMNFAVNNNHSIARKYNNHTRLITSFDKDNLTAGCYLLYNILFNLHTPDIIKFISNADVGIYKKLDEQYIMAYLKNIDSKKLLQKLIFNTDNNNLLSNIKEHGKLIFDNYLIKYKYDKSIAYITTFNSHKMALVAISKQSGYSSFLLNNLAKEIVGFAMTYYDNLIDKTRHFSLRSNNDVDVSLIAKKYGGGGHKNSSGFIISLQKGINLVNEILNCKQIE